MSAASLLAWRLMRSNHGDGIHAPARVNILHGDDIFGDGPYPRSMREFVGQEQARLQLLTAMASAAKRGAPLDHVLLASGTPGIGKTTLAKLVAFKLGRGYAEVGGSVTVKDIRPVLEAMSDGDVLFLDEVHRLVSVKRTNAEWLLQLLTDFKLVLPTGVLTCPRITVIAATTDAQKLPRTILDRFLIQPVLEPYSEAEAVEIAKVTARRLQVELPEGQFHRIAAAGDYNPRIMARLLATVRDLLLAEHEGDPVATALSWQGVSHDGLSRIEQDYLMLLFGYGSTASIGTMKAVLGESVLDQTERTLIQRGYITITGRGRVLTRLGSDRAQALMQEQEIK